MIKDNSNFLLTYFLFALFRSLDFMLATKVQLGEKCLNFIAFDMIKSWLLFAVPGLPFGKLSLMLKLIPRCYLFSHMEF